jgi:hypothetical protein
MILPIICNYFTSQTNIRKSKHKYTYFDFESDEGYFEVKGRNCRFNQYDTTLIPMSKIRFAQRCNRPFFFIFKYTDGIYYIRYDETIFSNFDVKEQYRVNRGVKETSQHMHIPIILLTEIPEIIN